MIVALIDVDDWISGLHVDRFFVLENRQKRLGVTVRAEW